MCWAWVSRLGRLVRFVIRGGICFGLVGGLVEKDGISGMIIFTLLLVLFLVVILGYFGLGSILFCLVVNRL